MGDKHLPAFSYRVPLTDIVSNRIPITKPDNYDPAQFELHRRFALAGGEFYISQPRVPTRKTDLIDSEAVLATDLLGMNDDWLETDATGRAKIIKDTTDFTRGLLYFFTSDPSLPVYMSQRANWIFQTDHFSGKCARGVVQVGLSSR
jgi:hypothetical protein